MEAAARTAERKDTEPGERPMTRHSMIQPQAAGVQPSAPDPRVSMVTSNANRTVPSRSLFRQQNAHTQRSGRSAFITALLGGGRAIAHTSRNPKSP